MSFTTSQSARIGRRYNMWSYQKWQLARQSANMGVSRTPGTCTGPCGLKGHTNTNETHPFAIINILNKAELFLKSENKREESENCYRFCEKTVGELHRTKKNKSSKKSNIAKYDVCMTWCLKEKNFLDLGALLVACSPSKKSGEDGYVYAGQCVDI